MKIKNATRQLGLIDIILSFYGLSWCFRTHALSPRKKVESSPLTDKKIYRIPKEKVIDRYYITFQDY